jgi:hypothetical protein
VATARWSCVAASVVVACILGCGAEQRRVDIHGRLAAIDDDLADEPAVRAARERGEAALAREAATAVFDRLDLRGRGLSVDNFQSGDNVEFSARLRMNNPFAAASSRRALEADTDVVLAEVEQTTLDVRAERCELSVDAAAAEERGTMYRWYREKLQVLMEWNERYREAGSSNELAARQLDLEASVRLAQREPRPADAPVDPAFVLPGIQPPGPRLRLDPEIVMDKVRRHHPSVAALLASQKRFHAYARTANRRRLPWFGFVEMSYELAQHEGFSNLSGQVTVEIPFGSADRADARRYEALGRSEGFEAEAAEQELARVALAALRELAFFEERAGRLGALLAASEAGRQLADRWLAERLGEPAQVGQLIDEAFEAHEAVVEARHRAGLAACALLESTGVPVADWPRASE